MMTEICNGIMCRETSPCMLFFGEGVGDRACNDKVLNQALLFYSS
jgi:hypothetical protein